jgi:hypothetical protein
LLVALSLADTCTMPLASMSNVTCAPHQHSTHTRCYQRV